MATALFAGIKFAATTFTSAYNSSRSVFILSLTVSFAATGYLAAIVCSKALYCTVEYQPWRPSSCFVILTPGISWSWELAAARRGRARKMSAENMFDIIMGMGQNIYVGVVLYYSGHVYTQLVSRL
eukprot:TRINITY_DN5606_c0_g1_i1.p1 TRINITY_DN5606_c0_g1~~TRINITY_DN5606_c0_g1_i1.p1  ORF type:complete len:126 (-),score=0.40 TRINITY_DN5606_c0_g1_i1:109-486(-)